MACPAVRALEASTGQASPPPGVPVPTLVTPTAQDRARNGLLLCLLLGRAGVNRKFTVILSAEG